TLTVRRSRRGEHSCCTDTCAWSPVAGPYRGRSLSHTLSRIKSGAGAVYFPSVAGCIACQAARPFPSRVHRHPLRPSPNGSTLSAPLPAPVHARMCSRASLPGSIARAGATGPPSSGLPVHSCRAHSPALAQRLLPHLDTEPSRDLHAAQVPGKKIECARPRGRGCGVPIALGVGEIHEGVARVGVCIEHKPRQNFLSAGGELS